MVKPGGTILSSLFLFYFFFSLQWAYSFAPFLLNIIFLCWLKKNGKCEREIKGRSGPLLWVVRDGARSHSRMGCWANAWSQFRVWCTPKGARWVDWCGACHFSMGNDGEIYCAFFGGPVMVAKQKEMESAGLWLQERDYCAHLVIDYKKCMRYNMPCFWRCKHAKHAWMECERQE